MQEAAQAAAQLPYRLGPGDKIHITIYREEELSGQFEINGAGDAALPLVGNVHIGGLTLEDASKRVAAAYDPRFLKKPQVSIEVLNYRPFFILGEVRNPGNYPYINGMTVLNAVALAGGFTYRAREDAVTIVRASDPDQREVLTSPRMNVLPGDIVMVQERFF